MKNKLTSAFLIFMIVIITGNGVEAQLSTAPFDSTWFGYNTLVGSQEYFLSSAKLADIDNDGDLDAVSSKLYGGFSGTANGFVVLRNNGSGFFNSTPVHYSSTNPSEYLAAVDLNKDGLIDVVVSNTGADFEGNSISVFTNLGNGNFGSPANYPVSPGPVGIATGDFNGDSNIDLAVANHGFYGAGSTISVLFNLGNGTFAAAINYPAGNGPYKIAAANINSDNSIDIVVANGGNNANGKLNVLLNSGTGGFSNRTEYSVSQTGSGLFPSVSLSDIDNDNDKDILYANYSIGGIDLFRNLGSSFSAPVTLQSIEFSGGIKDVETADLNNDGWRDIVTTSTSAGTTDGYQVLMNNGSGGFLPPYRNPAGQNTVDVMPGDIDNDGWVDILTADSYSMQITVHKNFGQGTFPLPHLFATGSSIAGSLDAADIDGDGDLDIVTSASGRAAVGVPVMVQKNLGNGIFGPGVSYSIRGGGVQAKFRDLNGDNKPDLLFATAINTPPYDFHFAINNGDGTFSAILTKSIGACGWYDIDAIDMDNNGSQDVIITEWLGCINVPESSRRVFICINQGNAVFSDPIIKLQGPNVSPIGTGDFNNDGNIDIAVGVSGAKIEISLGIGNGNLQPPVQYSIGSQGGATDLVVKDFNGDGNPDIASSNFWESTTMSVLFGNGNGTFQSAVIFPSAYSPDLLNVSGITAGDVDGDGDPDIMVGNNATNCLSLYENNNGVFAYTMRIGGYSGVSSPFYADFDGDGKGDLVAVGSLPPSGMPSTLMFIKGKTGVVPPSGFPLTVLITDGWNLVSIPGLLPGNQNVDTWWSGKDPNASVFRFNNGYQPVTVASPGQGYWLKHLGANTYNTGEEWPANGILFAAHDPIPGAAGWNLIGGYEQSVPVAIVTTTPPDLQSGSIYKYAGGYFPATSIDPGYGYWIKLNSAGQINMGTADNQPTGQAGPSKIAIPSTEDFGRITITDYAQKSYTLYAVEGEADLSQFDLPPYPPQGMFDIRYSTQRYAERLNTTPQAIEMAGVQYPVKLRAENTSIILSDETGKEIARLKAGEEFILNNSINKLYITGNIIPLVYSLEQNYPNPFNPSTTIQFSIPEDVQNVKLIIYNALGEKVAEIVNTGLLAGIYKYDWDAGKYASGVYVYQLMSEKFVSSKKLLLLK